MSKVQCLCCMYLLLITNLLATGNDNVAPDKGNVFVAPIVADMDSLLCLIGAHLAKHTNVATNAFHRQCNNMKAIPTCMALYVVKHSMSGMVGHIAGICISSCQSSPLWRSAKPGTCPQHLSSTSSSQPHGLGSCRSLPYSTSCFLSFCRLPAPCHCSSKTPNRQQRRHPPHAEPQLQDGPCIGQ